MPKDLSQSPHEEVTWKELHGHIPTQNSFPAFHARRDFLTRTLNYGLAVEQQFQFFGISNCIDLGGTHAHLGL